jgi:hypothetical protein
LITGKYGFAVKFFGNAYEEDNEIATYMNAAQYGAPKRKWIASMGYEPYEYNNLLDAEELEGLNDKLKPLMSSHTMNGNEQAGRHKKKVQDLSDSGASTLDHDSNANSNV